MAEEILSEKYKMKRKESQELKFQLEELENECAMEFLKCITVDYVKDLQVAINSNGTDIHKSKFKEFCTFFDKGQLTDEDMLFFDIANGIYCNKMPCRNHKIIDFYKNVHQGYVRILMETIEKYGIEGHKNQFKEFFIKFHSDTLAEYDLVLFANMKTIYENKMPN